MRSHPFARLTLPSSSSSSSSSTSRSKPINKAQELRDHLAEVIQGIVENKLTSLPSSDTITIGTGITSPGLISMSMGIVVNVFVSSYVPVLPPEKNNSTSISRSSSSSTPIPRLPLSLLHSKSPGWTAQYHTLLTAACYNGNIDLVKELFSTKFVNGLHINEISKSGIHPFLAACYGGNNTLVEYLIRHYSSDGTNNNSTGTTTSTSRSNPRIPLSSSSSEEILDINIALPMGSMGKTAIESAIAGDIDRIRGWKYYMNKYLISSLTTTTTTNSNQNNRSPTTTTTIESNPGTTTLSSSSPSSSSSSLVSDTDTFPFPFPTLYAPKIIQTLLKYGLSLTGQDYYQRLPLQIALDYHYWPGLSLIIQANPTVFLDNPYNQDNEGQNFIRRFEHESVLYLQQEFLPSSESPVNQHPLYQEFRQLCEEGISEIQFYVQMKKTKTNGTNTTTTGSFKYSSSSSSSSSSSAAAAAAASSVTARSSARPIAGRR